jgi:Kef-type K+ transport system membrane component KefB
MLMVFGSAKALGELAEWLRMPSIVGQILAGVLIGPSVLGLVSGGATRELAELGVMFLLFRVGLEVKPSELMSVGRVASQVAVLGIVAPLLMGFVIYRLGGATNLEALFVGTAMVATSVGITAQVLTGMGLLDALASRVILAAAVIDDILGLVVLAVVTSVGQGRVNVVQLVTAAAIAIAFTVLVVVVGSKTVGRVMPKVNEKMKTGEPQFTIALILLFALTVLASYVGVAAIIGAFLAGVALSDSVSRRVHDLAQGISELLVPFFLAGIGIAMNVRVLSDPAVALMAGLITVAAVVSKIAGCGLGALSLGWMDARRVGVGMVPRGEVGMVVAQIGASMGAVSEKVYGVVVVMAVMTTIIAPVLLKWTFGSIAEEPEEAPLRIE